MLRRLLPILLTALLVLGALPGHAAPQRYALQQDRSSVSFTWQFGRDAVRGRMAVSRADLLLDFEQLQRSRIAVEVDVTRADAGFPFASQAMRGPKVLDAARHPRILFQSTRVTPQGNGARVDGNLTVRGVTRPVTFRAEVYRQQGRALSDLSHLAVLLTGVLRRSQFGATGWSDAVGDEVQLRIVAQIARIN